MTTVRSQSRLQQNLTEIARLLDRHRVLDTLIHRQAGPKRDLLENLQRRQNLVELNRRLRGMHAADAAYVLEALSLDDRRVVWEQMPLELVGPAFVEVSLPCESRWSQSPSTRNSFGVSRRSMPMSCTTSPPRSLPTR